MISNLFDLTMDEIDAIVRRGMRENGISDVEIEQTFQTTDVLKLANMRAGVITLIVGLRALGWRVERPNAAVLQ